SPSPRSCSAANRCPMRRDSWLASAIATTAAAADPGHRCCRISTSVRTQPSAATASLPATALATAPTSPPSHSSPPPHHLPLPPPPPPPPPLPPCPRPPPSGHVPGGRATPSHNAIPVRSRTSATTRRQEGALSRRFCLPGQRTRLPTLTPASEDPRDPLPAW